MKIWLATLLYLFVSLQVSALIIGEISFEADFAVSETELREASGLIMGEEYQPQRVTDAIAALQKHLTTKGEYYIKIPNPELIALGEDSLKLSFTLQSVMPSSRIRIRYTGLRHFSESTLHDLAFSSLQDSYALADLPIYMQRVSDIYQDRGYLFARVELDSLVAGEEPTAWIRVQEGNIFAPKRFHFRGNKITRESTILKTTGLLGQSIITPAKLQQAEQNLRSRPYITSGTILPVDDQSLLIEITEGRMTYLEGLLGISEDGGTRKISGLLNIDFQNLWGSDRGIKLYWRSNPNQYSELKFRYHESGLPSLPLAADLELARSSQDSLWILSSVGAELYYKTLYQKFGISGSGRSVLPGSGSSVVQQSRSQRLGAFWTYQSTLGERIPTNGLQVNAAYHYIFNEGTNNGVLEASTKLYKPLKGRLIGHLGLNYRSYEKHEVAEYDLYRMGGFRSLRGFREDEFKSWRLAWLNSELRYMLGPQSMLYAFYDHGLIAKGKTELQKDLLAIGVGISMGTRLGILSLGYGLPYRDKGFSSFGLGIIHMGLDIAL
jgi:outer membrane protein assembly factor BamA